MDIVVLVDFESVRLNFVGKDCGGGVLRMFNWLVFVWEISFGELWENEKYVFILMIKKDIWEVIFE